ncbi:MAG: glycerol kinase GlpK [Proteobacteria bacterium]|nr:glycerol kinase GlpK [Pseudomonadota bacterium]
MTATPYLLAIDQGTTSSRALVFGVDGAILGLAQQDFKQYYPHSGWVEHDADEIWSTTKQVVTEAVQRAGKNITAIGITNQRETTIIWDRKTGKPIHRAIVWQDRRTADMCLALKADGVEAEVTARTGLLLDPYFSATKIGWLLDNVEGARSRAERGELAFGTVDTFLLWHLTGGRVHATDVTNASRTMLFNIHTLSWDPELLALFGIPHRLLPEVKPNVADFGLTDADVIGMAVPITAMAGDQHAATVGQACFKPGMMKSTYGTGCFAVLNTGEKAVTSQNKMLTTIAYQVGAKPVYALEGSIFNAGTAIQWLRDGLKLITSSGECEALAKSIAGTRGVYMVPAFTGLGAPHWDADARGALLGLTRDTGIAEVVRAALEAVCYQTHDLTDAMCKDAGIKLHALRVDGGMVVNDWLVQFLADVLNVPVDRPTITETTALGVAYLAGLGAGVYASLDDIAGHWQLNRHFKPQMDNITRGQLLRGWQNAVGRVKTQDIENT